MRPLLIWISGPGAGLSTERAPRLRNWLKRAPDQCVFGIGVVLDGREDN